MDSEQASTHSLSFRVRYEECGAGGHLRAAVHLRYLQELAFAHSAALGYPLTWYEAHRLFWLVRRVTLTVHAPARFGDELTATTQVVGMRRVLARRRNWIRGADGRPVASAVVDWIFTEDGATPTRVPDAMVRAFPALGQSIVPAPLPESPPPEGLEWALLRIRASDADAMGHANNAVYLDLLDDGIHRAGGTAALEAHPRTYDLQYQMAAAVGAVLRDAAWRDGEVWHYRMESAEGALLAHGRLRRGESGGERRSSGAN